MSENSVTIHNVGRIRKPITAVLRIFANDETEVHYPTGTICRKEGEEDGKLRIVVNEDAIVLVSHDVFSPGLGRVKPIESYDERQQRQEDARTRDLLVENIGSAVLEVMERAYWTPPEDFKSK